MTKKFNLAKKSKEYFSSSEIPLWFKILNLAILLPALLWPLVFFTSLFFFDNPKNFFLTFILFAAVNAYPVYLLLLAYGNYKLFLSGNYTALILPVVVLALLGYGSVSTWMSIQEGRKMAAESMKQQLDSGDLGFGFTKDSLHVYRYDTIIEHADPEYFETVNWQWERDNKHYFYQGKIASYVDYTTFQYLDYNYAKDRKHVYYNDRIIEGADAESFRHIPGTQDGRDRNNCYRWGEKVDCKVLESEE